METERIVRHKAKPARKSDVHDRQVPPRRLPHKSFVWALAGNSVFAAAHWAMIAMLARITNQAQVGRFALALAVCGPIAMLSSLQLRALLASDANSDFGLKDYLGLTVVMSPVSLAAVACSVWLAGFDLATSLTILLMGIAKNVESFSNIFYGALQQRSRLECVGKSLLIRGLASLVALGLIVWKTQSVAAGIVGIFLVWSAILIIYDRANVADIQGVLSALGSRKAWDIPKLLSLAKLGLPLAVSTFLLTLTISVPNLLIGWMLDESSVGVFAALSSLCWAGVPFINALGQDLLPRLGKCHVAEDYGRMRRLVFGMAFGGAVLGLSGMSVAWSFGEPIATFIYGSAYRGHNGLLVWLMCAACLLYMSRSFADALTAMRRARILFSVQLLTVSMVLLGGCWMIPVAGLQGMAGVLALALGVRALLMLASFWLVTSPSRLAPPRSAAAATAALPRASAA